jgi:hypothetical protein
VTPAAGRFRAVLATRPHVGEIQTPKQSSWSRLLSVGCDPHHWAPRHGAAGVLATDLFRLTRVWLVDIGLEALLCFDSTLRVLLRRGRPSILMAEFLTSRSPRNSFSTASAELPTFAIAPFSRASEL